MMSEKIFLRQAPTLEFTIDAIAPYDDEHPMRRAMLRAGLVLLVIAVWNGSVKADVASALAEIKKEERVKDVLYRPEAAVPWQIGVIADGKKWYGYASYICEVLKRHGAANDGTRVRIVDIIAVAKHNKGFRDASLGGVNCKDYSFFDP